MRIPRLLQAALAALAMLACMPTKDDGATETDAGAGGAPGTPGGGGGAVAVDPADAETPGAFTTSLAELVCANLTTCCAETPNPVDVDRCRLQFRTVFSSQSSRSAQAWDPAVAQLCLEEASAAAMGACLFAEGLEALTAATPACTATFNLGRGDAAAGEICTEDEDCAEADGNDVYCDDVCVHEPFSVRVRAGAGDACASTCTEDDGATSCSGNGASASSGECYTNDGLRCGETETCEPLGGADAPCGRSADCATGLYCGSAATCTPQVDVGAPCADLFGAPDAGACSSHRCDAVSLTCVPPGVEGEPCEGSAECATGLTCGDGNTCAPREDFMLSLCAELAGR